MFLLIVVLNVCTRFSAIADSEQEDKSAYTHGGKNIKANEGALGFYAALNQNPSPVNLTYLEKDEYQVRVPTKIYEEHKKKKKAKKSPKRTIQKIIKKGKNRSRKIYVHPVSRQPSTPTEKVIENESDNEELTTEAHMKKRYRKTSKVARYPMPFHRLQPRKDYHNRNRREVDRDDLFIINDLDEVEFVNEGKDYDVVKGHFQNYW